MLITEEYRKLNEQKHNESPSYGTVGKNYAKQVQDIARQIGAHTILDYGCGKRTLEQALGYAINNYDPAVPGCDAIPDPADLVVCTDVLEHIEPECVDAVLDDLKRVTKRFIVLTVSTQPARKVLADGRNAHILIKPADWWLPQLMSRFILKTFTEMGEEQEFMCVMKARVQQ